MENAGTEYMLYADVRPYLTGIGRSIKYDVPLNIFTKKYSPYSYVQMGRDVLSYYNFRNKAVSMREGQLQRGVIDGFGRRMDFI